MFFADNYGFFVAFVDQGRRIGSLPIFRAGMVDWCFLFPFVLVGYKRRRSVMSAVVAKTTRASCTNLNLSVN